MTAATPKTERVRIDSRLRAQARKALTLRGVAFTECSQLLGLEVEFTLSGLTWQVDDAVRDIRRMDDASWWDDQW